VTVKAIIFDLGGVIVDLDFSNFYNSIITQSPLNKPQTQIILEFFRQSDIYHQGLIGDEEFYHLACDLLQVCELDQKNFFKAFNSIIAGFNPEIVELIKTIKQNKSIKLLCLSNINSSHWEYLIKKNGVSLNISMNLFYLMKYMSPNPQKRYLSIQLKKRDANLKRLFLLMME